MSMSMGRSLPGRHRRLRACAPPTSPSPRCCPSSARASPCIRGSCSKRRPAPARPRRCRWRLLDAPWLAGRKIVMLEPRRVAARAAAGFMAKQLGEAPGETVGYRIRFESKVSARTRVEVVTEGILTRMLQDDPMLEGVGALLFDEFHERHLAGDLGLALALDVQAGLREDLRIVVMSATLDGERLARFLDAPRLTSAGRSVRRRHRALSRRAATKRWCRKRAARSNRPSRNIPAMCSCSCPASARSRRSMRRSRAARPCATSRCSRCTASCPSTNRRACWRRASVAASCCPPTSPNPASRCPACAS